MTIEVEVSIDGYNAEVIRLLAERAGKTPEEYVLSLFAPGCNAPLGEGCGES